MIIYEQPLNERIRLFMRLEHLFHRFDYYVSDPSRENSQTAIELLLELHEMTSRLDVKSAILKIIDHQASVIRSYEGEDEAETDQQTSILKLLDEQTRELYGFRGQLGQHMKNHGFLTFVKHRTTISGGLNGFDAPIFNHWISQPAETRTEQLQGWIAPYLKSREAIHIVMNLIRQSAEAQECIARDGFFQSSLVSARGSKNFQLLRVLLPASATFYPEISAGKQRFSIRFVSTDNLEERGKQIRDDVTFSMSICGF